MNIFSKVKINIGADSFQSAIVKKSDNKTLSNKSLEKLARIVNRQYKFNAGEANHIFGRGVCEKNINYEGVRKFINEINKITSMKDDSFIKTQIVFWKQNAGNLLAKNNVPKPNRVKIGEGARGYVYRDGDFIIKKMKSQASDQITHEANMCNEYNKNRGVSELLAMIVDKNNIKMPFVSGEIPSLSDTQIGIKELYRVGFLMGDAKPSNFLKTESGDIIPIDFGLVFMSDKLEEIDTEVKKEIIYDYIKGGYRYVPDEVKKEYISCLTELDKSLGKESPMRQFNIDKLFKAGFDITYHNIL